ncbi:MAG: domain S-box [Myxococcales bacterium]|nr:domain S-box [Myxococcales bacterium]
MRDHGLILELMSLTARLETAEEVMRVVTERLARHLGASRCMFMAIDFITGVTVIGDFADGLPSLVGTRVLGRVHDGSRFQLEQVRVITNEDTRTNERTAEFYDAFYGPAQIAALISAPLIRDGVPIGAFTVGARTPRKWTLQEAALVASVGERAWLLIERQRSVQALRESEARYRRIVEHAHEGIWEADPDGITLYVNARMAEMLGTTPEAMIGKSSDAYVVKAELDTVARLRASRRLGVVQTYEFPLRRADGSLIWTLISSSPSVAPDGRHLGSIGFLTDITERVNAVAQLRESEARKTTLLEELQELTAGLEKRVQARTDELDAAHRVISLSESNFRAIIETSPLGILVHQDNRIAYVNSALCAMLAYQPAALLGRMSLDLVHPEDHLLVYDRIQRLQERLENLAVELRFLHANGSIVWSDAIGVLVDYDGGPAIVVMLRNITAKREADQELKASVREKEVMVKEIHHRVKNNLQVVSSMLYLQSRTVSDAVAREQLEQSQARVRSIALVHEQLYRSKNLSRVDFSSYVASLVRNLSEVLDATTRGVEVRISIGDVPLGIDAAIACGLMISELVTNALKHAFHDRQGGHIEIVAERRDGYIELRVADNGIGLPAGLDPRSSTTLGLELVYTFAEQIGASVELRRSPGTTFVIKFEETDDASS